MFLRTTVSRAHSIIPEKKKHGSRDSFANPFFRISQTSGKERNAKYPELDFIIEIHFEDGFLGSEIRFSRSITNP